MDKQSENNRIQQLISQAIEMTHQKFDPQNPPHFEEIAKICRQQNRISDEIGVLKLAVDFYTNPDLQYDEKNSTLVKFQTRLTARQKEAKVLQTLGW